MEAPRDDRRPREEGRAATRVPRARIRPCVASRSPGPAALPSGRGWGVERGAGAGREGTVPWVPACGGGVCPVSRPRVPAPARARGEARTPALGLRAMRAAPKGRKSLTEAHAWSFLQTVIWVPGDPRSLRLCPSSTSPTSVWPLVPSRGGRPTAWPLPQASAPDRREFTTLQPQAQNNPEVLNPLTLRVAPSWFPNKTPTLGRGLNAAPPSPPWP